jgi:uncharacterized membrane protein (UPF0127 family)
MPAPSPLPHRLARLPGRTAGGWLVLRAERRRDRLRGLARLPALPDRVALLIPRCRSVHTFGMRCALDLIWVGARGTVLRVDRDVAPRRVRRCRGARSVVETPAGGAAVRLRALGRTNPE